MALQMPPTFARPQQRVSELDPVVRRDAGALSRLESLHVSWRFLATLSLSTRLHQAVRCLMMPFGRVLSHLPCTGVVVDLGCGYGTLLAMAKTVRPELSVVGIDLSAERIESARLAFRAAPFEAEDLRQEDIAAYPPASADCVVAVDVMYLIPWAHWPRIFEACYACLKPGGRLLLKEMNRGKRLKFRIGQLQELLAVKLLRWTLGAQFTFPEPQAIRAALETAGFTVASEALDRGFHVSHHLWVATK